MIRLALAALTLAAAASPALAYSTQQIQAPHDSVRHEFGNATVMRMAPSGVSSNALRDPAKPGDAKTVIYELPANPKPAGQIDINDPKDNPFIARHLK
jgi:hypothetical protein